MYLGPTCLEALPAYVRTEATHARIASVVLCDEPLGGKWVVMASFVSRSAAPPFARNTIRIVYTVRGTHTYSLYVHDFPRRINCVFATAFDALGYSR